VVDPPDKPERELTASWVTASPRRAWGKLSMPWKECSVVEERLRFVARLLEGEAMSEVCRQFGISRKTDNPFGPRLSPMS
jgi:hypothetical protein